MVLRLIERQAGRNAVKIPSTPRHRTFRGGDQTTPGVKPPGRPAPPGGSRRRTFPTHAVRHKHLCDRDAACWGPEPIHRREAAWKSHGWVGPGIAFIPAVRSHLFPSLRMLQDLVTPAPWAKRLPDAALNAVCIPILGNLWDGMLLVTRGRFRSAPTPGMIFYRSDRRGRRQ